MAEQVTFGAVLRGLEFGDLLKAGGLTGLSTGIFLYARPKAPAVHVGAAVATFGAITMAYALRDSTWYPHTVCLPNLQHTPARHGGVMALRSAAGSRANEAKRVNAELFTFTYGSLVAQLLKDYEDDADVNTQLEKMGYNIGCRLIEDFLARSGVGKCSDFRETADVIAKLGFKMFLGMQPAVTQWSADGREFTLVLDDNPFIEYVELPPEHKDLLYCNLICGVLRGALEMVQMKVEVGFVKDVLRGDESSEVRVRLVEMLEDGAHHQD